MGQKSKRKKTAKVFAATAKGFAPQAPISYEEMVRREEKEWDYYQKLSEWGDDWVVEEDV